LHLQQEFGIEVILVTRGGEGAEAFTPEKKYFQKAKAITAIDTVGCGDAFLACFVHHYYTDKAIDFALNKAVELSGFVATQQGAIPEYNYENFL
jgi:fructokinase